MLIRPPAVLFRRPVDTVRSISSLAPSRSVPEGVLPVLSSLSIIILTMRSLPESVLRRPCNLQRL